jgi:predicted nucleic acid-binding protein
MKIVCDSSSIITLSTNCLLWLLDKFETDFLIPLYVKKEIMDNPINTKKYAFEAMRNGMVIGKALKVEEAGTELRDKIIRVSNSLYMHKGRPIEIIQYGEADALALAIERDVKTLLVDEKNTRLLIENNELLRKVVERRTGRGIDMNEDSAKEVEKMFKGLRVIRSSELVAVAVKRGIFDWPYPKRDLLRSMLTAVKLSGCAISSEEISEIVDSVTPA